MLIPLDTAFITYQTSVKYCNPRGLSPLSSSLLYWSRRGEGGNADKVIHQLQQQTQAITTPKIPKWFGAVVFFSVIFIVDLIFSLLLLRGKCLQVKNHNISYLLETEKQRNCSWIYSPDTLCVKHMLEENVLPFIKQGHSFNLHATILASLLLLFEWFLCLSFYTNEENWTQ